MQVEQAIYPLNVTAATLVIQLLLAGLLVTASLWMVGGRTTPGRDFLIGSFRWALLERAPVILFVATIVTMGVLLDSEEFNAMWSPMLGGAGVPPISAARATAVVFFFDMLLVGYLVAISGGSANSPFLSALFMMPALAIFLRASPTVFLLLAFTALTLYVILFFVPNRSLTLGTEQLDRSRSATAFVNIACLVLSMFTGYITRPASIDQLQPLAVKTTQGAPASDH